MRPRAALSLRGRRGIAFVFGAVTLGAVGCSPGTGSTAGTGGSTSTGGSGSGSGGASATGTGGSTISGSGGSSGASSGGAGGTETPGSGGATTGGATASGGTGTATGGTTGRGGAAGGKSGSGGSGVGGSGSGGTAGAGFVDLFDGTTLTGFNVYKATTFANNAPGTLLTGAAAEAIFKPENGMIHVYANSPDKSLEYHYLLQTVASYSKYNLSWEYKWGTKKFQIDSTGRGTDLTMFPRDAGVLWQIHGTKGQIWPSSIEFQNKWGSTGDIFALYAQCMSPAGTNQMQFAEGGKPVSVVGGLTQHMRSANFEMPGVGPNASTGEGSDWNTCLLQVNPAGVAVYSVNGHVVNGTTSVSDSAGNPVTSGQIAWQGEQAEVYYRNLRIQVIP